MDVSKSSEANRGVDNVGTCEEPMPRWNSLRFAGLLALADAASAASGNGEAQGNDGVATSSFMSDKCQNENNGGDDRSASLFWNRDPSLDTELGANGNSMPEQPYYVPAPQQQSHDINLPQGILSGVNSSMTVTQLVPITPEKDVRVQNKPVSEVQDLYANERTDEEREKLENEVVATRVDTNEVQRNKELSKPVIDSSFAAVSTPFKENHNPDKGGSHGTDLNEAPQKKPKRKRHRPKVGTEGKPKRTPKSVTSEATGSKENPTVKGKYVRMKRINISSAAPPVELTEESTDLTATPLAELTGECTDLETLELARKSCRRGTKFEIGQTQDESSAASKENLGIKRKYVRRKGINKPAATPRVELAGESCKSSINLDSELQAQDFSRKGVQSRSTVQLGEGIALVVEHTEAGIAYDISCSVNQMLKEYMSLPERQVPSTPLLTKTNPPQPELNAVSQKASTTEGETQLIAHNGQENIAKTNNQISLRSPKGSNYSTNAILTEGDKATRSKRRYSHAAEQSDASIRNLVDAYFSTLDAYQMINRIHFPNINKKKRTEKGQNSTTCSSSSCFTATKNVERTATCLQHDAETIPCSLKASRQASGPPPLDDSTVSLRVENKERGLQNYRQSFEHILALIQKDRSTRKGSRGPTQVRDLNSLTQLVPITPEKGLRVQNKPVSEVQNLYPNERTDEEREKLENEVVAARIDTNEVQRNKELSKPVIDSSFAAVSTPFKENHNPDKGGSHGTGLNETPQQKPKWKKHWPMVVTEGKPKRTPKRVTPEATGSKENLTVKRKYVRMKSINISSAAPPAELTEESTDLTTVKRKYVRMKSINISSAAPPAELTEESTDLTVTPPAEFTGGCTDLKTLEPARKSSRRATIFEIGQSQDESSIVSKENLGVKRKYVRRKGINKPAAIPRAELTGESSDLKTFEPARKSCRSTSNFDIEQLQDESSTCKSSINLDSELQAQDFSRKGVQSRSTVQLGEGIALEVKHPEAGIAYDIACSMNQMLKEYISLPERQVPTTPLLTKTNPPRAELNADSQKDSTTEGEVQLIAHNGQENIAKTNNQISLRSPNDSNYSTSAILTEGDKATRSKRQYSHAAEQSDASIRNLVDAYFSTLDAYQMINRIHFPNINKKKRTEKGQNSTTYSSSSCITATKNVERTATCLQHDAETIPCSLKASRQVSGPPPLDDSTVSLTVENEKRRLQNYRQSFEHILALIQKDRSTRKGSRGPTRVPDLTSPTRILECITHPTKQPLVVDDGQTDENPHKSHTYIDDLVAKMRATLARKKRTKKRNSLVT